MNSKRSGMRVSCAEQQRVTIYFGIICNTIIHWYETNQAEREIFKGKGDNENNGGTMRGKGKTGESKD